MTRQTLSYRAAKATLRLERLRYDLRATLHQAGQSANADVVVLALTQLADSISSLDKARKTIDVFPYEM